MHVSQLHDLKQKAAKHNLSPMVGESHSSALSTSSKQKQKSDQQKPKHLHGPLERKDDRIGSPPCFVKQKQRLKGGGGKLVHGD